MGFLTTFTIYNDGADQLEKDAKNLAKELNKATAGLQLKKGYNQIPIGNHANLITIQKPRHADNHTLYLHAGNTVIDLEQISKIHNTEFFIDTAITEMKYHLEKLRKLKKERIRNK